MRTKLFTLILALVASVGTIYASDTQVDGIWYDFNSSTKTASVTYRGSSFGSYFNEYNGSVTIPSSVTYHSVTYSVTSIGKYAFAGSSALTSIDIPNSIKSIGESAFSSCSSLTSVTIPNSVIIIGICAFFNCTALTSVTIGNSVTSIGNNVYLKDYGFTNSAFFGCTSLTSVVWNAKNCSSPSSSSVAPFNDISSQITSFIFGEEVDSIPAYLCYGMSNLKEITIPNSVTGIGKYAFANCSSLPVIDNIRYADTYLVEAVDKTSSSYTIKEGTKWIGSGALKKCTNMTSIEIPNSVTSIEDDAFYDCSNLTVIDVKAITPPAMSSSSFENIYTDAIVYVLFGAMKYYSTADYWQNMKLMCTNAIHQEITYSSTSCTLVFDVEDIGLQSCGIEGGEQQAGNTLEYIGLEPKSEYKNVPIMLTSTTGVTDIVKVSFTTSALELTTQESKPVSSNTAILLAETNMADIETSCGFEWKRNDAPEDMTPNKVFCPVANGMMAGRLKGLKDEIYYKYRAFYQSAAGNMFYGDWKYIFTGDVTVEFDPIIYTYSAVEVKENEATLKGYALAGSEDFTEQGFEYWAESRANNAPRRANALGEHHIITASGISMKATLTDLDPGTIYRYRSYANIGSKRLYGSEMTLTTLGEYHDPQAIEDIHENAPQATKILHEGQIYILRGNHTYTLTGQEIK